jgi:hypothetical protein
MRMKRNKIILLPMIVFVFITLILYDGCHSYYPLVKTEEQIAQLKMDEHAIVTLRDGACLETDAYHHFEVVESTDLVVGTGIFCKGTTNIKPFYGVINISKWDSIGMKEIWGKDYFVCWLKDGGYVKFKDEDYLHITKEAEKGLWCVGKLDNNGKNSLFKGVLWAENIRDISVEKISVVKTYFLLLFTVPVAIYSYLFITYHQH